VEQRALAGWFSSPLGCSLQAAEVHHLRGVLPALRGLVAVQVSHPGGPLDWLAPSSAITRIGIGTRFPSAFDGSTVQADCQDWPLDQDSVDLVLFPHTLDFCALPHAVLRECARVLRPEGNLVVLGFNPFSLWGMYALMNRALNRRRAPWNGRFLSLNRLRDWLSLLDFESCGGAMLYYRPPAQSEAIRQRLQFLEPAGDRWLPMLGAVYVLIARKKVVGMTPLKPRWRQRMTAGLAEPAIHFDAQR
jgi:SAM-dependent methyltransferase